MRRVAPLRSAPRRGSAGEVLPIKGSGGWYPCKEKSAAGPGSRSPTSSACRWGMRGSMKKGDSAPALLILGCIAVAYSVNTNELVFGDLAGANLLPQSQSVPRCGSPAEETHRRPNKQRVPQEKCK